MNLRTPTGQRPERCAVGLTWLSLLAVSRTARPLLPVSVRPIPATAYSGDLVSTDDQVQPADENVPIIDLKEGQRLEIEAEAVLNVGREHAKHQGGVAVGYRHLQRVEVVGETGEFDDDEPQILRGVIEEAAAEHAVATDGQKPENGNLVVTETFDNDLSKRYPGKELAVTDVETDGSFTVDDLVVQAVGTIEDRARELKEAVQL